MGRKWTAKEVDELVALRAEGVRNQVIGEVLGRSEGSIQIKVHQLKLPRRINGGYSYAVQLRLPLQQWRWMSDRAHDTGTPIARWIRSVVERAIAEESREGEAG
jgi:hypothetical protein